uniref:Uncharacterized protein n=1 Tax=Anguilla anguilla TaxID=7936 RepID=A0A0E9PKJ5_ANGAN
MCGGAVVKLTMLTLIHNGNVPSYLDKNKELF